jgi:hypothetical protein
MKEAKDVLRIVGMILLGLFVFMVAAPLVMKLAGITYGIITGLIFLAILLIKVAVVLAIGYLILVEVRALLRSPPRGQPTYTLVAARSVSSRFVTQI